MDHNKHGSIASFTSPTKTTKISKGRLLEPWRHDKAIDRARENKFWISSFLLSPLHSAASPPHVARGILRQPWQKANHAHTLTSRTLLYDAGHIHFNLITCPKLSALCLCLCCCWSLVWISLDHMLMVDVFILDSPLIGWRATNETLPLGFEVELARATRANEQKVDSCYTIQAHPVYQLLPIRPQGRLMLNFRSQNDWDLHLKQRVY
jgi:hypothetical protein